MLSEEALKTRNVVLDRYWASTASYAALDDDPPRWERVGDYPAGILKPDAVVLLTVDEANREKRIVGRGEGMTEEEQRLKSKGVGRDRVMGHIQHFDPIAIDTSNRTPEEVLNEVIHQLQHRNLLKNK